MMAKGIVLGLWICLLASTLLPAQDTIALVNPSFEDDFPRAQALPSGWIDRGNPNESPPDIQPGVFNVFLQASNGLTYVGLVVRDNNTWEGIGQPLNGWMMKDSTYSFSLDLARAKELLSESRATGMRTNFAVACILQIWVFNSETKQRELLAFTEPVVHNRWERYEFKLKPLKGNYNEINLFAYYKANTVSPYNGNILIDNCSPIVQIK